MKSLFKFMALGLFASSMAFAQTEGDKGAEAGDQGKATVKEAHVKQKRLEKKKKKAAAAKGDNPDANKAMQAQPMDTAPSTGNSGTTPPAGNR